MLVIEGILAVGILCVFSAQEPRLAAEAKGDQILLLRPGGARPILIQEAKPDFRPYVHPIVAPDGKGELTEFSPSHHRHQTGLYWGITRLNGRDYFHHPGDGYFKRQSARVLEAAAGTSVRWEVVYHLMGEDGRALLEERQTWAMRDGGNHYLLDLLWEGRALTDITVGKYDYGGLFLRMPWKPRVRASALNSEGQENRQAEGKRARWVDVGLEVPGRLGLAHIVIMDHPDNPGHPTPWRVDDQLGVGPCYARLGEWKIPRDRTVAFRHRLLVYTGEFNPALVLKSWESFVKPGGRR